MHENVSSFISGIPVAETEDPGYRPSKKATVDGLPLTNPTKKISQPNGGTSAAGGKKDPYLDMGTPVLTADKRAHDTKSSQVSSRSILLQHSNGTVVSSGQRQGIVEGKHNPYSEMGVSVDFPEKKSNSNGKKEGKGTNVMLMGTPVTERRMLMKHRDPYADLGSSSLLDDDKGSSSKKATTEPLKSKADVAELTEKLNKLLEKAKEISKGQQTEDGQLGKINKGNSTTAVRDPYADVGSLTKKTTQSLAGSKKDFDSSTEEEEFDVSTSETKSNLHTGSSNAPAHGISGNSVTGMTSSKESKNFSTKTQDKVTQHRRKDPYADVGSAVDIKEKK